MNDHHTIDNKDQEVRYGVFHTVMVSRIPLEYDLYEIEVSCRSELGKSDFGSNEKAKMKFVEGTRDMHGILKLIAEAAKKYYDFRIYHH